MRWARPLPPIRYREPESPLRNAAFLRIRALIRVARLDRNAALLAELDHLLRANIQPDTP